MTTHMASCRVAAASSNVQFSNSVCKIIYNDVRERVRCKITFQLLSIVKFLYIFLYYHILEGIHFFCDCILLHMRAPAITTQYSSIWKCSTEKHNKLVQICCTVCLQLQCLHISHSSLRKLNISVFILGTSYTCPRWGLYSVQHIVNFTTFSNITQNFKFQYLTITSLKLLEFFLCLFL